MSRILLFALCLFNGASASFASDSATSRKFIGKLSLIPMGCESSKQPAPQCKQKQLCRLGNDFGYFDGALTWQADKGNCTDGASIPSWAQPIIGEPFRKEYVPAAVLHDHYSKSERPVRSWLQTQRMFYRALLDTGVPPDRAAVLYAAVLIGSGKWIKSMRGKRCELGVNCVNTLELVEVIEREAPSFETDNFDVALKNMREKITALGLTDPKDIEKIARPHLQNPKFLDSTTGFVNDVYTGSGIPIAVE